MNSKRSSYRGFGIYLLLILAIIGIWYWMDGNTSTNSYTRAQFETAVADGNVAQLKIVPNRGEVPTGNVYITFKDSSTQVLAVNDVNDIEDYLRDQQFTSYTVENPPEQSWIVTILPYLIIYYIKQVRLSEKIDSLVFYVSEYNYQKSESEYHQC